MKFRKRIVLMLISTLTLLLFTNYTFAQKSITGIVSDVSREAIPGVSVIVKGTSDGTMTDLNGKYSINVNAEAKVLVFSYIGKETKEIAISGTTINCTLNDDASELDEVVVIGYGAVKKKDATGSVTAISSDDFNKGAITSPQDLIMGKISGVQITTSGGAPGDGAVIRIRGGSSLSASNDPLIVIDGVPVDNEGVAGMRNPLNSINPNDIETFTVLKDASATAIYGSRASNGVIIITTKKGKIGGKFKVNYNGTFSYNTIAKKADVLNAGEYRNLIKEQFGETDTAYLMLGDANTDWQDVIFQNSFGHDHNLSFSGASRHLPYRVSFGYASKDGTLKNGAFDRMTEAISLNPSFLNNHLNVNLNLKGMNVKNRFADQGAIGAALAFDPTHPIYDETSPFGGYYTWMNNEGSTPNVLAPKNPLSLLEMHSNNSSVDKVIANTQLDYKFHFLPELRANLNVATERSQTSGKIVTLDNAPYAYNEDGNKAGYKGIYTQKKSNDLLDFYLNYTKELNDLNHKIDVTAGYSWQHFHNQGLNFGTNYEQTDTLTTKDDDYNTEYLTIGFFGRLNYSIKNKYLLTFTLRRDGTSRFSPENRWGYFPSGAFAWKIKEENFLKNSNLISDLKLRLGYGVTGQQNIGGGDYQYLARYTYSNDFAKYLFGNTYITMLRPEGYNENLKWEETSTLNAGLDFGFIQDKIIGTIDVYYRKTKDLLNYIPIPAGTNFTNQILSNVGNLENKGIEFSITDRIITKKDLSWEASFNVTYNKTIITKLTAFADTSYKGIDVGGFSGGTEQTIQKHTVGFAPNTFYVFEQVYDNDGNPIEKLYVDRNEDGVINEDDRYMYKKPTSDFYFGISSRLNYKNWDASFSGRANIGNYVYNNVSSNSSAYNNLLHTSYFLSNLSSSALTTEFNNGQYLTDYYIEDASFFKLDNITLGYRIEKMLLNKLDIHLSATVQNVFTITKYSGLDPEVFGGIDNNIYPRPRTFIFGVNIDF